MRKITKSILLMLIAFVMLFTLAGCGKNESNDGKSNDNNEKKVEQKESKDAVVFDYINKIKGTETLEEVNQMIGSEGEKGSEGKGWTTYEWKISDDTKFSATFYETSKTCEAKITFKDDLIKNDKVDFSKYNEIKSALNKSETVTYDQVKEKFGGVDGTLTSSGSSSKTYRWVNSKGGYLSASFSTNSGKCTFIMGRI